LFLPRFSAEEGRLFKNISFKKEAISSHLFFNLIKLRALFIVKGISNVWPA